MDSTEKIVLQEMRREIEQQMAARKQQPAASQGKLTEADEVDYTTVSDGELLKFLRARRYQRLASAPPLPSLRPLSHLVSLFSFSLFSFSLFVLFLSLRRIIGWWWPTPCC